MRLNQDLPDRKRNRIRGWNYSKNGWYAVTICVHYKVLCLGEVNNGKMILNNYGKIVEKQWNWLEVNFPYVELSTHVIMPNHIHGIVIIHNSNVHTNLNNVGNGRDRSLQIKIKSLSELMGAFKTTSSKFIHQLGFINFSWQKSFYDHVIRNDTELLIKQKYIFNNSLKWDLDKNNPKRKPGKYYFEY